MQLLGKIHLCNIWERFSRSLYRVKIYAIAGIESLDEWPNVKVGLKTGQIDTVIPIYSVFFTRLGWGGTILGEACGASGFTDSVSRVWM
jgi:hypothetical protein